MRVSEIRVKQIRVNQGLGVTIYSAYMILRSIWTVFKNAILHTNEVSKISPATKSLFCSDLLLEFVETY